VDPGLEIILQQRLTQLPTHLVYVGRHMNP
jgi:hypothetical protein